MPPNTERQQRRKNPNKLTKIKNQFFKVFSISFFSGRLHLNRQVITLLSGLGVSDNVFLSLQEDMLFSLADMMMYDKEAIKALSGVN